VLLLLSLIPLLVMPQYFVTDVVVVLMAVTLVVDIILMVVSLVVDVVLMAVTRC